jgi:hypothetical protein
MNYGKYDMSKYLHHEVHFHMFLGVLFAGFGRNGCVLWRRLSTWTLKDYNLHFLLILLEELRTRRRGLSAEMGSPYKAFVIDSVAVYSSRSQTTNRKESRAT